MSAGHLLQRLLLVVPTLFGVGVIVFVLLRVVPGNPIAMMTPPGASAEDIEHLKSLYGFDKSVFEQFRLWLGGILRGDFGTSISLRQGVAGLILNRLPATLELGLLAAIFSTILCLLLSLTGSYKPRGLWSQMVNMLASVLQAVPDFLWALLFILLLGVAWPLFPISGRVDPRLDHGLISQFYLFESLLRFDGAMALLSLIHI